MVCIYDVIDFIRDRFATYDKYTDDEIHNIISEHIKYGTISILLDKKTVVGLMRVNINGNVTDILDMAVREGYDSKQIIREMALEIWKRFPYLKYFKYYRSIKYPLKKAKIYTIKRLMKVK